MNIKAQDLMNLMEEWAPARLAESWDHPGLQVGNPEQPVKKVLISLDLTEANVDRAAKEGAAMIISHHPFLFKSLHRIDLSTYKGRVIEKLIKHDILSFAAHTNLDTAKDGVNDALADALDLTDRSGLVMEETEPLLKVAAYTEFVKAREFKGILERKYKGRSGHFYLLGDADDSSRMGKMEFNAASSALKEIMEDLRSVCGEVHCDIYELKNGASHEYMGRLGKLPRPMEGKEALLYIKEKLGIPDLRYAGNTDITVCRVAVLGGAGSEFASLAKAKGADLYLTGDLKYHEAQDAAAMGLLIADGGHFFTERVVVPKLAEKIRREAEKRNWDLEVLEDSGAEDIFGHV